MPDSIVLLRGMLTLNQRITKDIAHTKAPIFTFFPSPSASKRIRNDQTKIDAVKLE